MMIKAKWMSSVYPQVDGTILIYADVTPDQFCETVLHNKEMLCEATEEQRDKLVDLLNGIEYGEKTDGDLYPIFVDDPVSIGPM